ncbi:hypothetical protein PJ912_26275 [Pectobacterium colocasium]
MTKPMPIESASQYPCLLSLNGDTGHTQRQGAGSKHDVAYKVW